MNRTSFSHDLTRWCRIRAFLLHLACPPTYEWTRAELGLILLTKTMTHGIGPLFTSVFTSTSVRTSLDIGSPGHVRGNRIFLPWLVLWYLTCGHGIRVHSVHLHYWLLYAPEIGIPCLLVLELDNLGTHTRCQQYLKSPKRARSPETKLMVAFRHSRAKWIERKWGEKIVRLMGDKV